MVQPLCCVIGSDVFTLSGEPKCTPKSLLVVLEHPADQGLPTPGYRGNHSMLAIDVPKLRQQQDKSIGFVQAKALPFASH